MNKKYNFPPDVKWISFGCSYAGSLSAWLRLKYPYLIQGAVSANGPLLAQVNFEEYYTVVSRVLSNYGENCVSTVRRGFQQIDWLIDLEKGRKKLNQIFKTCNPLQNATRDDISTFYALLAQNFGTIVQYNNVKTTTSYNTTINQICDIMTNKSLGAEVKRLGAVNDILLRKFGDHCLDYTYKNSMDYLRNTSWNGTQDERQWNYQSCTEFGYFQSSDGQAHIFGNNFPVCYLVKQCANIFGATYSEDFVETGVRRTNMEYGGLHIRASNVVFVSGSLDPWHVLQITRSHRRNAPAINIKDTAHCAIFYAPSEHELPQLTIARQQIEDLIDVWLKQ